MTTFERSVLSTRYPEIPAWFAQYEVPADLIAEIPPCVVYCGLSLMEDPHSARWMVFLSEWLAIIAKQFLWSASEGRVYILPTMVVEWLRRLNFTLVLGGAERQGRLQALLDLHETIDWPRVPYSQGHHFDNPRNVQHSPGRRHDAGRPDRGNWVRVAGDTPCLSQPEYLRGASSNAERGGEGGRRGEVRVAEHSGESRRVRRRGVGFGRGPGGDRERGSVDGPATRGVIPTRPADVVMTRGGEAEGQPSEGAEGRDGTTLTDATLRDWLRSPHWRAQLRRLVTEETGVAGEVAAGRPAVAAPAVAAPAGPSTRGRAAGAVVTATEAASEGLAPPEDGLPKSSRIEQRGAVREEDLAEYEGETDL